MFAPPRQRRFKSIVEKAGFKLENGKQVNDGTPINQDATTRGNSIAKTTTKPQNRAEPGTKRRKGNKGKAMKAEAEAEDENLADGQDGKLDRDDVGDGDRKTT